MRLGYVSLKTGEAFNIELTTPKKLVARFMY